MSLPASGPIALSTIQAEFGGSAPISLSEYYAAGLYVPAVTPLVPKSGQVSVSAYRGKSVNVLVTPNYPAFVLGQVNVVSPWVGTYLITNWPDAASQWIWNTSGAQTAAPTNVTVRLQAQYYNGSGADQAATIWAGVDNSGTVYVNNVAVLTVPSWMPASSAVVTLSPGYNLITIHGANAGTAENPAGAVFAMYVSGAVVLRSGSGWTYY